jgi:cobalt-zinc-cadmium efflux system membrane fusion protein
VKTPTYSLLLCACLALAACSPKPEVPAAVAQAPDPVLNGRQLQFVPGHPQLAQLGIVAAQPASDVAVDLPARFVWNEDRTQRIYPSLAGRVERILADVGQSVKPGTALAQLSSPDFGVAQADTAKAQADARLSQRNLARQRELFEAGVIARKDLDQAEADAARAAAELQRAEARSRLYGGTPGASGVDQRLALSAGIPGVIVERNLNPSQELRPDAAGVGVPPLFVVTDPTSLWVLIDARETEADALRPGASFELTVPSLGGRKVQGRVLAAGDFIDPATRTLRVRGLVANPDRQLKAEMLASARIQRKTAQGVVVPSGAVKLEGAQHAVMVQVAPGVFESREVIVGQQGPSEALITAGLQAGEQVVLGNMLLLARQYRLAMDAAPVAAVAASGASAPSARQGASR